MGHTVSRRSVAKGAAWGVPALAVASAAPAIAASCTPTTVRTNSTVRWTSTQVGCSSINGGDPELHTVRYTLLNEGPDSVPAGVEMDITIKITVLQGEDASVTVQEASPSVAATVVNDSTNDDAAGTTTLIATVKVVTSRAIAQGDSAVVTVVATYGALSDGGNVGAQETVTAESPQTHTDNATCVTTIAALTGTGGPNGDASQTLTLDGASDGTSYRSSGDDCSQA